MPEWRSQPGNATGPPADHRGGDGRRERDFMIGVEKIARGACRDNFVHGDDYFDGEKVVLTDTRPLEIALNPPGPTTKLRLPPPVAPQHHRLRLWQIVINASPTVPIRPRRAKRRTRSRVGRFQSSGKEVSYEFQLRSPVSRGRVLAC